MIPVAFVEAYNKTLDMINRIWDWKKERPRKKLEEQRKELEEKSRQAQLIGDTDELTRIRAKIKEIDRQLSDMSKSV